MTDAALERSGSFVSAFVLAGVVALAGAILWGVVVQDVEQLRWGKEAISR